MKNPIIKFIYKHGYLILAALWCALAVYKTRSLGLDEDSVSRGFMYGLATAYYLMKYKGDRK